MTKRIGYYAGIFGLVWFATASFLVAIYPQELSLLIQAATSPDKVGPAVIAHTRLINH